MSEVLEFKLVQTNVFTRWPCHLCGGCTEKVSILCEAENGFRICEQCLRAGDLDAKLIVHAEQLECNAAELRSYVGRLKVPSYAEWHAASRWPILRRRLCAVRCQPAQRLMSQMMTLPLMRTFPQMIRSQMMTFDGQTVTPRSTRPAGGPPTPDQQRPMISIAWVPLALFAVIEGRATHP